MQKHKQLSFVDKRFGNKQSNIGIKMTTVCQKGYERKEAVC